MPVDRQKIRTFLSIITLNCQNGKPFRMEDVTRYVKVSSNAGTVLKKLGYVSRGKDHGKVGHEWELHISQNVKDTTFENLVEEVAGALDAYKALSNKRKNAIGGQLSIIPEESLPLLAHNGCECTINRNSVDGKKDIEKYAAVIAEELPPERNNEDLQLLVLDIKEKVDKIFKHFIP